MLVSFQKHLCFPPGAVIGGKFVVGLYGFNLKLPADYADKVRERILGGPLRLLIGLIILAAATPLGWGQFSGFGSGSSLGGGSEARIGRGSQGIRPFASISAAYDTNTGSAVLNSAGAYETRPSYGVEGSFGIYGTKSLKRDSVGVNFRGDYVNYTTSGSLNGSNVALSLAATHQFDKSWYVQADIAAGTTNRTYGALQTYIPFDSNFQGVPTNEVINSRTNYGELAAHVTYLKSRRLNARFGGSTILTRRANRGLAELNGFTGDAGVSYLFNRSTTISAGYQFNHYQFLGTFGASDIHGASFSLNRRINRDWSLRVGGQGYRMESLGSVRVQLDPLIALLLGRTTGTEAFYRVNYIPGFNAAVDYKYKQTFVTVSGNQGISPGNGIYLTSRQTTTGVQVSHTAERVWNFGVNVNYTKYGSLTRSLQQYKSILIGGGVTRQLNYLHAHAFLRADHRHFDQGDLTALNRDGYRISVGLGFSPGAIPLSLW